MKGGKALPLQYPPVSGMTAKLHENKSPLWLCFGRGGKKTQKNTSLRFGVYSKSWLIVGGNGKITVKCWCFVTITHNNLAGNKALSLLTSKVVLENWPQRE